MGKKVSFSVFIKDTESLNAEGYADLAIECLKNERLKKVQNKIICFIVQTDESLFSRRKYERGRTKPQRWVFGASDNNRGGQVYMMTVEKRDQDNLLPL